MFKRPLAMVILTSSLAIGLTWAANSLGVFSPSKSSEKSLAALRTPAGYNQAQTPQQASSRPFALIELFTSEGCSSCPSADRNLEKIAQQAETSGQNIYTLSYHVDYWNYLGWSDPYSKREFTDRQRQYSRQFKSDSIYTPQMVVNGKAEFVGSKQLTSKRAIDLALKNSAPASIAAQASHESNNVKVVWQADGVGNTESIHVALVQNSGQQDVARGENARRKLTHVNIVRELKSLRAAESNGSVELEVPKNFSVDNFHVVIFSQTDSAVTAVTQSKIKPAGTSGAKKLLQLYDKNQPTFQPVLLSKPIPVTQQAAARTLLEESHFLGMLSPDRRQLADRLEATGNSWDASYVPMLLDVARFLPVSARRQVMGFLESKTNQRFGRDIDRWLQWNWKQNFTAHPGYAKFKASLYRRIDPRFTEYFADAENPKIRLDEIRWGGVLRDGIPPLKNPKMLTADQATYLADTDIVFGIKLGDDARAYPKRILAWHEMFKDTIGGESVCGVY